MVFEAYRATGDRWAVRYRHPLSAYQAFAVAIAALHNPTSAMLDMLPPLDEVRARARARARATATATARATARARANR